MLYLVVAIDGPSDSYDSIRNAIKHFHADENEERCFIPEAPNANFLLFDGTPSELASKLVLNAHEGSFVVVEVSQINHSGFGQSDLVQWINHHAK